MLFWFAKTNHWTVFCVPGGSTKGSQILFDDKLPYIVKFFKLDQVLNLLPLHFYKELALEEKSTEISVIANDLSTVHFNINNAIGVYQDHCSIYDYVDHFIFLSV